MAAKTKKTTTKASPAPCSDDACEFTPEMIAELSNGKGEDEEDEVHE